MIVTMTSNTNDNSNRGSNNARILSYFIITTLGFMPTIVLIVFSFFFKQSIIVGSIMLVVGMTPTHGGFSRQQQWITIEKGATGLMIGR